MRLCGRAQALGGSRRGNYVRARGGQRGADADLRTLAATMADKTIHAVVVPGVAHAPGRGDRPAWGIVSDVDLMRGLRPGLERTTAVELAAVSVLPTDTLEHAAQLMAEHDTAHLLVVSPDSGRPVGIVSTLDIARVAAGA